MPTAIVPKARRIKSFAATADEGAFEFNSNVGGETRATSFGPETETEPIIKEAFPGVKLPENEEVAPRLDNAYTMDLVEDTMQSVLHQTSLALHSGD